MALPRRSVALFPSPAPFYGAGAVRPPESAHDPLRPSLAVKYVSTRGPAPELGFEDVLLAGLARDGGLYVPAAMALACRPPRSPTLAGRSLRRCRPCA